MKTEITLTQKFSFGPAMSALNDRQRAFVVALNNAGGKNAAEAARAAGYLDSGGSGIWVTAHRLCHDPNVQAAIIEDARARIVGDLHATLDIIDDIANNPQHKDRLSAAKLKLHHAGMVEVTKVQHEGTVTISFDQKLEKYKALLAQTGGDPDKALAPFIEAEFTEVVLDADDPDWKPW